MILTINTEAELWGVVEGELAPLDATHFYKAMLPPEDAEDYPASDKRARLIAMAGVYLNLVNCELNDERTYCNAYLWAFMKWIPFTLTFDIIQTSFAKPTKYESKNRATHISSDNELFIVKLNEAYIWVFDTWNVISLSGVQRVQLSKIPEGWDEA